MEKQGEQLSLFDLGVDMSALRAQRGELAASAQRSASTLRAYASDWRRFKEWCGRAGRVALPASGDTVALYITSVVTANKAIASAARYAIAIAHYHREARKESPITDDVRAVLAGGRHKFGVAPPGAKAALAPVELRRICRKLLDEGTAVGVRDRALLVLGFASGLRRSELSALEVADITMLKGRRFVVRVRRAKNDQNGRGREIGIFPGRHEATCPARALAEWLQCRGTKPGPLFTRFRGDGSRTLLRLTGRGVAERVRICVELIGLDASKYGGHSLRAGCVTAASSAGVPDSVVMDRSGHRSHATMRKYQRSANLFSVNPLANAL